MFFSKITLIKNTNILEKLNNYKQKTGYYYHQLIWDLFSENNPDKKRDFIYHAQIVNHWPSFYIVSATQPHDNKGIWDVQCKTFNPQINENEKLNFRLRVNPRVCRREGDKKKYFDIIQDAWQKNAKAISEGAIARNVLMQDVGEKWLKEKAITQHGFKVEGVIVENFCKEQFKKKNHNISFSTLDFVGRLTVIDKDLFIKTLSHGIGSAKGFGCGLLMVKR